ncbi:unnamed protein product [Ranitomeya imitator]|uniref:Uncharacterized protein n=1 Tax=Ranitomeya imitator TaxID=111125 RepID=A0ABN9M6D6_9NEOB|nr:unnamed protein product [Ranitomeya imitator]
MARFEEEVIYTDPCFCSHSLLWKCYIDDVFCIWDGTSVTLNSFLHNLNSAWPELSFTITSSSQQVNFLDTMVIKDHLDLLKTDFYTKSTDRNSLLHFDSLHPPAVEKSIPHSQFSRVRRIVSDPSLNSLRVGKMHNKFRVHGDLCIIEQWVSIVPTYHPFVHILHKTIICHWDLIQTAHPNIPEFHNHFLPCYKRTPNIRDTLCNQCNVLKGNIIHHPHSGKRYSIEGCFTFNTSFVFYLIKCPCRLLYVGETTQAIKDHRGIYYFPFRTISSVQDTRFHNSVFRAICIDHLPPIPFSWTDLLPLPIRLQILSGMLDNDYHTSLSYLPTGIPLQV